ncbi:MAG TPA: hypothetical protein VKY74_15745 [Chloroflexia bacterium]|nr:hypothetical protein [Chloroflexia bacterium]
MPDYPPPEEIEVLPFPEVPPAPAGLPPPARRRRTDALLSLLTLALLLAAGIGLWAWVGVRLAATPARAPGTPGWLPTSVPRRDSTLLFTMPIPIESVVGLAAAPDGSFWVGDRDNQLYHYGAMGVELGVISTQFSLHEATSMKIRGAELWVLSRGPNGSTVLRATLAGRLLAQYPMSELMAQGLTDFTLGAGEQVLIQRDLSTPVVQLVDQEGQLAPHSIVDLPVNTHDYIWYVSLDDHGQSNSGWIARDLYSTAGGAAGITLVVSNTLTDLQVLHMQADGSIYVVAEEWVPQPAGFYDTLLHYALDGHLIAHARLPGAGPYARIMRDTTVAPDGEVYCLVGQPGGTEIRRVTFFSPVAPLPPYQPAYRNPDEPTPPPYPSPTPVWDLATLARKADTIVEGQTGPRNATDLAGVGNWAVQDLTVRQWLTAPPPAGTPPIRLIPTFGGYNPHPPSIDLAFGSGEHLLLFLTVVDRAQGLYNVTGGPAGAFGIANNRIHPFPPAQPEPVPYEGWTVDRFERAIAVALTPVAAAPAPTDLPASPASAETVLPVPTTPPVIGTPAPLASATLVAVTTTPTALSPATATLTAVTSSATPTDDPASPTVAPTPPAAPASATAILPTQTPTRTPVPPSSTTTKTPTCTPVPPSSTATRSSATSTATPPSTLPPANQSPTATPGRMSPTATRTPVPATKIAIATVPPAPPAPTSTSTPEPSPGKPTALPAPATATMTASSTPTARGK